MKASTNNLSSVKAAYQGVITVQTTLYDLIDAVSTNVEVGEERLIAETVIHMLNFRKIKFIGCLKHFKVIC